MRPRALLALTALLSAQAAAQEATPAPDVLEAAQLQGQWQTLMRHEFQRGPDWQLPAAAEGEPDLRDDHTEWLNRLAVGHYQGPLTLLLQLDSARVLERERFYIDPDNLDSFTRTQLVRLQRATLRLNGDHADLALGDFYMSVGAGGLLRMSNSPALDLDVALDGAWGSVSGDALTAQAFIGRADPMMISLARQNLDPARIYPPYSGPDDPSLLRAAPDDVVLGAALELQPARGPELGLAALGLSLDPETVLGLDAQIERQIDVSSAGLWVGGAVLDVLDLYAEGDVFSYAVEDPDGPSPFYSLPGAKPTGGPAGLLGPYRGYLAYGSAVFGAGAWTVLAEAKRSRDNQHFNVRAGGLRGYAFATPPSLEYERAIVEDSGFTVASNDILASHGRVERGAGRWVVVRADLFRAVDHQLALGRVAPERIVHALAGVEVNRSSGLHLSLTAGRRRGVSCDVIDQAQQAPGESAPCLMEGWAAQDRLTYLFKPGLDRENDILHHLDAEIVVPAGADSIELSGALLQFTHLDTEATWFYQWQSALTYHRRQHLTATVFADLSNNGQFLDQRYDDAGALINDQWWVGQGWLGDDLSQGLPSRLHWATELSFNPGHRASFKLFYGSIMGGIRCAGGQCRPLPAFSGARAEATLRF